MEISPMRLFQWNLWTEPGPKFDAGQYVLKMFPNGPMTENQDFMLSFSYPNVILYGLGAEKLV